jgi:adenine/guanine phosphoribosyltransferase-like PRPP-binding protein
MARDKLVCRHVRLVAGPEVLRSVGPALADLHRDADSQAVVGIESRGFLLGPLTAVALFRSQMGSSRGA